ncbi:hypothetical protein J8TS2_41600 [Lederbergia ruris]|uniref:Uncharacterized protein n=1 Tax=Lederbergia ruris TaxID=217495 RepID=A0ABQ4KPH3_9BACI|nr:hypothetical protein J8TS2_41600 [Lederbergia ruris]
MEYKGWNTTVIKQEYDGITGDIIINAAVEYCGHNEPLVRRFEPPFADNRASECKGESRYILLLI